MGRVCGNRCIARTAGSRIPLRSFGSRRFSLEQVQSPFAAVPSDFGRFWFRGCPPRIVHRPEWAAGGTPSEAFSGPRKKI